MTQVGWNINAHHPKVGRSSNIDYHAGYFYGKMDSRGFINGDKVVYLYPDFETVLVGQFLNETMISAQQAKLKGVLLNCAGNAGCAGNADRLNRLLQDYLQGVTQKVTHATTGLAWVTAKANSGHH